MCEWRIVKGIEMNWSLSNQRLRLQDILIGSALHGVHRSWRRKHISDIVKWAMVAHLRLSRSVSIIIFVFPTKFLQKFCFNFSNKIISPKTKWKQSLCKIMWEKQIASSGTWKSQIGSTLKDTYTRQREWMYFRFCPLYRYNFHHRRQQHFGSQACTHSLFPLHSI